MLLFKTSILLNILEYTNIYDLLNVNVLSTHFKDIISQSIFNMKIVNLKKKYIKDRLTSNSCLITEAIKSIQSTCPHLYLLTSDKTKYLYIKPPVYNRKCVICNCRIVQSKDIRYNSKETNWQYYLRNENVQYNLILRTDLNKRPNIMNIMTKDLNSFYNNPANRYSFIRMNIIHKLGAIQLLIASYCDNKEVLFLNKSWSQFMIRNKAIISNLIYKTQRINSILFDNEIYNFKLNCLKQDNRCSHKYILYKNQHSIMHCVKCKHIKNVEDYQYRCSKKSKYI